MPLSYNTFVSLQAQCVQVCIFLLVRAGVLCYKGGEMSRDFYNPLLLLIVVILLACRFSHVGAAGTLEVWVLVLCSTGFVIDGSLAMARALTHRPGIMKVVWAVVFLIVGCCTWVMATTNQGTDSMALADYRTMYEQYRNGADVNARNENGDSLLLLAVECGKENVVRNLLNHADLTAEQLPEAAMRAIASHRTPELVILLEAGVSADAALGGTTLLCAAASHANASAVSALLEHGANPSLADESGVSPLSNAVISGHTGVVKLLRAAGANPAVADPDGRMPDSYSRTEKMDNALQ